MSHCRNHSTLQSASPMRGSKSDRAKGIAPEMNRGSVVAGTHVLVGMGVGWLALSFIESVFRFTEVSPLIFQFGIVSVAFWMAVGLRRARRRYAFAATRIGRSRSLAVAGGLSVLVGLLSPEFARLAHAIGRWASAEFLWMSGPLIARDALLIFVTAAYFAAPGYLIGQLLRVGASPAESTVRMIGGLGCGLAGAYVCVGVLTLHVPAAPTVARLAALPFLLTLILVARLAIRRKSEPDVANHSDEISEPEAPDYWPTVLRLALGIVVITAASAVYLWRHTALIVFDANPAARYIAGSVVVALVAVGILLEGRGSRDNASVSWCGKYCTIAGVQLAAGIAGFALIGLTRNEALGSSPIYQLWWIICAGLPMIAMGRAVAIVANTVLRRVSSDAHHAGQLLEGVLIAIAVAVGIVVIPTLNLLGSYAGIVAVALCLVATGGVLLIHDPTRGRDDSGRRIVAVFASVIAMTVLLPMTGGGWLRRSDPLPERAILVESWWGVHLIDVQSTDEADPGTAVGPEESPMDCASILGFALRSRDRDPSMLRSTLVTEPWHSATDWDLGGALTCLRLQLDPVNSPHPVDGARRTALDAGRRRIIGRAPAIRWLRTSADRHDVLMITLLDIQDELTRRLFSAGMVEFGYNRLTPDGVLAVAVQDGRVLAECMRRYPAGRDGATGRHIGWAPSRFGHETGGLLICARNARTLKACLNACGDGSMLSIRPVGQPSRPVQLRFGAKAEAGSASPTLWDVEVR